MNTQRGQLRGSTTKRRLSRLAVLAFLSSMPCITVVGAVYRLLPLGHAFVLLYVWLIESVVGILWGAQVSRSAGLTEAAVFPSLMLLTVPPAIVLGLAATIHIDRSRGRLKGVTLCMTSIEIALTCSLLMSPLVLNDLKRAREAFRLVRIEGSEKQCRGEILATGAALKHHTDSHDGDLPDLDKCAEL